MFVSQGCSSTSNEAATGCRAGEVALRPELKDEQRPELVSMIANPFHMLTNQHLDILGLKESLLTKACRRECILQKIAQLVTQPVFVGNIETQLGTMQYLLGENILHGPLE